MDRTGESEDEGGDGDGRRIREDDEESSSLRERLYRHERENRFLIKDSNERKTMEEVFDRATVIALNELFSRGDIAYLNGVVRSGKEARVYWGVTSNGTPRAVKIYLTASVEFKKRMRYIAGDRRFAKLPNSIRAMIKLWVQKEFKNLQLAEAAGVRVPKPYDFKENALVMEYIGEPPAPAPTFSEVEVDNADYVWTMKMVKRLYQKAELVHGDLSEFNIFKFGRERVLFDMGSAVLSSHPEARELLRRDITNMVRFFKKRGIYVKDSEKILEEITQ
jgi:RIO kinase 1